MKVTKVSKKLSVNKITVSNLEMGVVKGGVIETGCLSNCPCYTDKNYTIKNCENQDSLVLIQY